MRTIRVFHSETLSENSVVSLAEDAANHVVRVLRLTVGAEIKLFDNSGYDFTAEITAISKRDVQVKLIDKIQIKNESPLQTHIGHGVARGEKMDFVIQKSVELGVNSFTPLFTERCEVKLNAERLAKRLEHWRKVAISACEQSGRAIVPTINPACKLVDWYTQITVSNKFVLDPKASQSLKSFQTENISNLVALIGPEGGLSDIEIESAKQQGFVGISLGPRILRTETAALTTLSLAQQLWGDL